MQTFGPYTPIRQAGNTYYVSGQVGVDPDTKSAAADVKTQTSRALTNMATTLASVGLTMQDVVKTTIYVTDMSKFSEVNEVYEKFFDVPRPARATVGVAALPNVAGDTKLVVEIEAIAHKEAA